MAFVQHLFPHSSGVELLSVALANVTTDEETVCSEGSNITFWLGWLLFGAQIPLCYLPQYVKLYEAGTHIGLSLPNTICFALVAYLQFLTFICREFHATFDCCGADMNWWQCGFAMAPFLQTVTAWFGSTYTIKIYFEVFDRPGLEAKNYDPDAEYAACWRQVWATVFIHLFLLLIPVTLVIVDGAVDAPRVRSYGLFCSIACSTLIASHWFLQMHETWRMQAIGSLSLVTCFFSSTGSGISAVVFFQHGGWVPAFPFIVGTFAIAMAMTFALWVDARAKKGLSPEWGETGPPPPLDALSFVQSRSFTEHPDRPSKGEKGVEMRESSASRTLDVI